MRLLKFIVVGAAVGYGVNYIIKKNDNGRSILDDLVDNAPDWLDHAKKFAEDAAGNINGFVKSKVG